jgi:Flp pilus assembly protein TadD
VTRAAPRTLVRVLAVAAAMAAGACATTRGGLGGLSQDTYETRKSLARELIARGEWPSAFGYADALHRERPKDPEALVLRGTIYRERGLWTEAEADLLAAIHLDGRSAEAHAALGILYDVTLRPDAAEPQHREAIKLAPNSVSYLNNLGFCLFLRGKTREAITYYEQAARLEPTSRRVRTNLGFAFAATGDLRRAAHEFEMGGTAAEAKNNLGFAYERRGDFSHAYDLYLEATTLDPQSSRAHSNLVHAAQKLGRPLPAPVAPAPVAAVAAPPAAHGEPSFEPSFGPSFGPPSPPALMIDPPHEISSPSSSLSPSSVPSELLPSAPVSPPASPVPPPSNQESSP